MRALTDAHYVDSSAFGIPRAEQDADGELRLGKCRQCDATRLLSSLAEHEAACRPDQAPGRQAPAPASLPAAAEGAPSMSQVHRITSRLRAGRTGALGGVVAFLVACLALLTLGSGTSQACCLLGPSTLAWTGAAWRSMCGSCALQRSTCKLQQQEHHPCVVNVVGVGGLSVRVSPYGGGMLFRAMLRQRRGPHRRAARAALRSAPGQSQRRPAPGWILRAACRAARPPGRPSCPSSGCHPCTRALPPPTLPSLPQNHLFSTPLCPPPAHHLQGEPPHAPANECHAQQSRNAHPYAIRDIQVDDTGDHVRSWHAALDSA